MTKQERHAAKMAERKAQYRDSVKRSVTHQYIIDACDVYLEHMDMLIIKTLIDDFSMPPEAMEAFYYKMHEMFQDYKRTYTESDTSGRNEVYFNQATTTNDRSDSVALKMHLKAAGFDYEAVCRNIMYGKPCSHLGEDMAKAAKQALKGVKVHSNCSWVKPELYGEYMYNNMQRLNMSVKELSDKTLITENALRLLLKGAHVPRRSTYNKIRDVLGDYIQE